jgi:hypothetical protein
MAIERTCADDVRLRKQLYWTAETGMSARLPDWPASHWGNAEAGRTRYTSVPEVMVTRGLLQQILDAIAALRLLPPVRC